VSADEAKPARRKWWKYLLVLFLLGLIAVGGAAWYMTTDSFQAYVRARIVDEMEKITGGRVELGTYHTIPFRLQAEIRGLTIHGTEAPDDVPLAHADRVVARIRIISLLETEFGFKSIVIERPVIHLIVHPDGTTNIPAPKVKRESTKNPVEELFSLSIRNLQVREGNFLWNDQATPFDFEANNVAADMSYSFLRSRYDGTLVLGRVSTRYRDYQPFSWTAAARFSLSKNEVEVSSLKLDTGRSHLEASGRVRDFFNPVISADYKGALDLAEIAFISRQRELRAGFADVNGKGTWTADKFASDGKLALKNLEWRDDQISVRDASLSSDFSVNDSQLKLSKAQGRLLGGGVVGDLEVTNWLAPQASPSPTKGKTAKERRTEEQKGLLRVRMKDISASALAAAVSTRQNPLDRLNLAGNADGTIDARWTGSPSRAEAAFAVTLAPPAKLKDGQIPVTANARGTYRAYMDELEFAQLDLATRATQIHANGKLAGTSSLQLTASTSDLAELQPLIVALHGPSRLPVTLHGSARFTGAASGKVSSASLSGHLQIQDFDSIIPATDRTPEQTIHWDTLAADIQVSPRVLAVRRASAVHGDTTTHFDMSASLTKGDFTPQDTFTANVDMKNADIAEVQALAGYHYPVTGRANLMLQASGTRAQPHAEGHIQVADAVVYGQPIHQFESDLRVNGSEASLNNMHVGYYDAQASGGAAYDLDAHTYHFNLTGKNFDLTRIPSLQTTRVAVEGRVDFTAQGSGTREKPVINANLLVRDLTLDRERAGNLNIDAVSEGETIHLTARSEFEHAQFNVDGTVQAGVDYPADLTVRFNHFDLDSIFREYLNGRIAGHSGVTGVIQVRGPLRKPRDLAITANLDGFDVTVDEVALRNEGPIRVSMAQQMVRLEQFHIVGENTNFSAHGTASLAAGNDLDLAGEGHLNLQLIQTLNSNFTSSGQVDLSMTVSGPVADPLLQGKVTVSHGSLAYADLPSGLSDMNGALTFNKNRLQIDSLTARSGGGMLTLTGGATTYQGQINFDFSASAQDVRLRYPPGVSSTADADLRFYGTREGSTLSGDLTITKLAITPGFDFAAYAASSSQSVVVPPATSPLYRVKLDVHVTTAPDLQMQTAIARLSGDADLRLRGTAAKPALLGRVEVLEGEINFNGAKYRLERGEVLFQSPISIKPVLDLQATTRVRDYDITVSINGDTSKPLSVKYRSDPPLPEADIVALIAVGQTREQSAQLAQSGDSAFSQTASNLILSEALNSTVSNRVQRLLGISKIKIDPQGLSTETNPTRGPQVTIEQQISNDFTLTYSQNVSQASQQIIQGEYYIRRNVSIVGTRDQNGVVSFDVKIRQRKK
jgi:translocation and assembly module TamB